MVKIRDSRLADLPELMSIYNEAIVTTSTFDETEKTLEERLCWYQNFVRNYPLIVAELNNEVIGYCCLSPFHTKPAYRRTVELSIYLSGKHQGGGIGSRLMKEIIARAKDYGFHTIISKITAGNEPSIKLHQKFGFQFAGTLKEVGFKFGDWLDVDYYQLFVEENRKNAF